MSAERDSPSLEAGAFVISPTVLELYVTARLAFEVGIHAHGRRRTRRIDYSYKQLSLTGEILPEFVI